MLRFCGVLPYWLLRFWHHDFLPADHYEPLFRRVSPVNQACTHAETADCTVAFHIDVGKSHGVVLEARLERFQIKAAVLSAEGVL